LNLLNEEGTVALKLLAELDELLLELCSQLQLLIICGGGYMSSHMRRRIHFMIMLELCSQLQLLILGALKRLVGHMYIYKVSRSLYKVSRSLYKGSRSYIYIHIYIYI